MSLTILKSFSLDFTRNAPLEYIFAKAGDQNSRILEITPLNSGAAYTIPSGTTARFAAKKPDGTQILNDATISSGEINVTLSEQTLAADGVLVCEVQLYGSNDEVLSSQHFYLRAYPFALSDVESSDEYDSFRTALLAVDAKVTEAEEAIENAEDATSDANTAAALANTKAELANTKAALADQKATEAGNVNIAAEATATGADITVTDRDGVETTVHIDTLTAVETWNDIRNAVRTGIADSLFPVGYEFPVAKTGCGNIVFVVRDHDHHTAANGHLTHTMTLEMKYAFGTSSAYKAIDFDATEAIYYAETELAAGTYYFTVANQAWYTADNTKKFQFTLTNAVPAGGQIVLSMTYNATLEGKSVKTYASASSSTVIETATLTEGDTGTSLGTTDGTGNMNHMHRAIFGSNNYAQSALRQWLNSNAAAGSVWAPQTKFDRAPSWAGAGDSAYAGFMNGLDSDFLAVVEPAVLPCRTNSIHEVNSLDGTTFAVNQTYNLNDKFFLLSRPEIYGTWDSTTYKDGEVLDFYSELTDTERKKYDSFGSVHSAWLRSPYPGNANYERIVGTDGSVYYGNACNGYGAAVACIIA